MPDENSSRLLQEASLEGLSVIWAEIAGLFDRYGENTDDITPTFKKLFSYLSSRSQAVSFLVSWGYSWDAEIILRSFYETGAKILFICFAEEQEKPVLVDEFWNKLGSINDRRTARKAGFSGLMSEERSISASIFSALQDDRIFDLEAKGSKAERKRLEQKWSFSEILQSLDQRLGKENPLIGMRSLLHIYGMASHLAHADNTAMDLMTDRAIRESNELKTLEAGHTSRIFTDQVGLTWFCADALRRHFKGAFMDEEKFANAFHKTIRLSEPLQSTFEESQREFYENILQRGDE